MKHALSVLLTLIVLISFTACVGDYKNGSDNENNTATESRKPQQQNDGNWFSVGDEKDLSLVEVDDLDIEIGINTWGNLAIKYTNLSNIPVESFRIEAYDNDTGEKIVFVAYGKILPGKTSDYVRIGKFDPNVENSEILPLSDYSELDNITRDFLRFSYYYFKDNAEKTVLNILSKIGKQDMFEEYKKDLYTLVDELDDALYQMYGDSCYKSGSDAYKMCEELNDIYEEIQVTYHYKTGVYSVR